MSEKQRCFDLNLGDTHLATCREIALRAADGWRQQGIDDWQIQHSLRHFLPAIWPSFATEEEIRSMRWQAAEILEVDPSKIQIDAIRRDGLVNLFVDW